jgi:hypothetical protein
VERQQDLDIDGGFFPGNSADEIVNEPRVRLKCGVYFAIYRAAIFLKRLALTGTTFRRKWGDVSVQDALLTAYIEKRVARSFRFSTRAKPACLRARARSTRDGMWLRKPYANASVPPILGNSASASGSTVYGAEVITGHEHRGALENVKTAALLTSIATMVFALTIAQVYARPRGALGGGYGGGTHRPFHNGSHFSRGTFRPSSGFHAGPFQPDTGFDPGPFHASSGFHPGPFQ